MKVIRIFNAQPVKIPQFKSLLTLKTNKVTPSFYSIFFDVHIMNVDYDKF